MKLGIDYLGAAGNSHGNYIETMCRHHPKGFAAGFLLVASDWKNGIRAAKALAKTGKCPVMRLHGLWLGSHRFGEEHIAIAVKEAKRVAKLAEQFPDIRFFFSPWLEHRADATLWRKCRKACRAELPRKIRIVSSGPAPGGLIEYHGSTGAGGRIVYSYDGEDMLSLPASAIATRKKFFCRAILFMGWTPACNLRRTLHDKTSRGERKRWLTAEEIQKMAEYLRG